MIQVDDGGEPRKDALDAVDSFYFLPIPAGCKTTTPVVLSPNVTEGNIVVSVG
jgi:hypothetical protein